MKLLALLIGLSLVTPLVNAATPKKTSTSKKKKTSRKRKAPQVTPQQRAEATAKVQSWLQAEAPIQNAAALSLFYLRLRQSAENQAAGPIRVIQFGDSHTAGDSFTGELRRALQQRFGDGGPPVGRPAPPVRSAGRR